MMDRNERACGLLAGPMVARVGNAPVSEGQTGDRS